MKGLDKYTKNDYMFRAKFASLAAKDIKYAYESVILSIKTVEDKLGFSILTAVSA